MKADSSTLIEFTNMQLKEKIILLKEDESFNEDDKTLVDVYLMVYSSSAVDQSGLENERLLATQGGDVGVYYSEYELDENYQPILGFALWKIIVIILAFIILIIIIIIIICCCCCKKESERTPKRKIPSKKKKPRKEPRTEEKKSHPKRKSQKRLRNQHTDRKERPIERKKHIIPEEPAKKEYSPEYMENIDSRDARGTKNIEIKSYTPPKLSYYEDELIPPRLNRRPKKEDSKVNHELPDDFYTNPGL